MLYALMDCEARIDHALLRRCRYPELPDTPEGELQAFQFEAATLRERQNLGPKELPWFNLQWHVPIAISVGVVDPDDYKLQAVETIHGDDLPGLSTDHERDIVATFWARAEAFRQRKGVFVSFNGRSYDVPLLELHALRHGIATSVHLSGSKPDARYRFQTEAHLDLLEFITNFGAVYPPRGGLGFYLEFLGYPGKGAIDGSNVQDLYDAGEIRKIRAYNRNDIRRLFLLFLRVQVWRGQLEADRAYELAREIEFEEE